MVNYFTRPVRTAGIKRGRLRSYEVKLGNRKFHDVTSGQLRFQGEPHGRNNPEHSVQGNPAKPTKKNQYFFINYPFNKKY